MKPSIEIFLSITVLLTFSCNKGADNHPSPQPERSLSMPEKVEKEMMDVLSKDWKSLSDTLAYFNSTMLSKGRVKGKAPDGVFYELSILSKDTTAITAEFKVQDSIWCCVNGKIAPLEINLHAFETEIAIKKETKDSTGLSVSKIKAVGPDMFFLEEKHQAILFYEGLRVGFITREKFENTDYSTGTYLVVHYYGDPRSFAMYENGLGDLAPVLKWFLLKIRLSDVLK